MFVSEDKGCLLLTASEDEGHLLAMADENQAYLSVVDAVLGPEVKENVPESLNEPQFAFP